MKRMDLKECKQGLVCMAKESSRKDYGGDAINTMFKFYVLELIERVAIALENKRKRPRKPTAYNLFFGEQAKKGLSPSKIAELWNAKKQTQGVKGK